MAAPGGVDTLLTDAILDGVKRKFPSPDELAFDKEERDPDEDLHRQFEAISGFGPEEKKVARALLESLIPGHEVSRWSSQVE